jgi:hypothetical protein
MRTPGARRRTTLRPAAVSIDLFLIGMIALSFSGLLAIVTFEDMWVWLLFDLVLAAFVIARPERLRAARPLGWLMGWLLLYFSAGYVVAAASNGPDVPAGHILRTGMVQAALLVLMPLMIVVGMALRDRRQWDRLAAALQVAAIGACGVSVAQTISPAVLEYTTLSDAAYAISGPEFSRNRVPALWRNPNQAAFCFFFAYAISLWCRIGWLAWTGRIASLLGAVLTVSRGGWLIMAAFTAAYVLATSVQNLLHGRMKPPVMVRRMASAAGIAAGFACLAALLPLQRAELVASMTDRVVAYDRLRDDNLQRDADVRYFLAAYWLNEAMNGPWYGQGLNSFQVVVGDGSVDVGPHNQFVMVFGELGLVGLVAYLLLLAVGLHRTWATPMIPRDRLILLLIWGVVLFWHFKGHGLLNTPESIVMWSALFMAPHVLRKARPRVARVTPWNGEMRFAVR